jgi:SAM-dependent methyltransferase
MRQVSFDGESLITPKLFTESLYQQENSFDNRQFEKAIYSLSEILNTANIQFEQGFNPSSIVHKTAEGLHLLRNSVDRNVWQEIIPIAQEHPVAQYFLQDPFTRWSFTKPRGYSGDAGLLDFIYGHPSVAEQIENASPIGRALYDYTKDASSSVAVRERRDLLTKYVDGVSSSLGKDAEVLTIAAGHLREANASHALQEGRLARWVALDQDPHSVESIKRDFAGTAIQAVEGSVRGLLTKANTLGQFDFIYAAGLYDYLSDKVSAKLTQRCLSMLKPKGVFLFANFATEIGVDGYMETFMNWPLLLRTEGDMKRIISASTEDGATNSTVFFGENRNIVYGIIQKLS